MRIVSRYSVVPIVTLILFLSVAAYARVETVPFHSKLVNTKLPYNVILPADYDTSPRDVHYSVLYLLHGLTGHYSDWTTKTNIANYASEYRLIIVMPEGNDGWYTNSSIVPNDKYESYILQELIPDVQQRYRTLEARHARAIAGLSMGGYGAIKFGLKSPETFAFAASMSGAFGITRLSETEVPASWQPSLKLFGPFGSETRKANDLFELVEKLSANQIKSLPYFYFDCGTEDSPLIFPYNRQLAQLMFDKKIPHEYRQMPGGHSWGYWDRQVKEVLRIVVQTVPAPKIGKARGV